MLYSDSPQVTKSEISNWLAVRAERNGFVLNDLRNFAPRSMFYFCGSPDAPDFAFLHRSGHPAIREIPAYVVGGAPSSTRELIDEVKPTKPLVIRETSGDFERVLVDCYPGIEVTREYLLTANKLIGDFRFEDSVRLLSDSDAESVRRFQGMRKSAKGHISGWLSNALVVGAFVDANLVAMGSTFYVLPEVCGLVAVRTLKEHQRQGYGRAVVSKLVQIGLDRSKQVVLSVRSDNAAALRMYESVGFVRTENRIWANLGHSHGP